MVKNRLLFILLSILIISLLSGCEDLNKNTVEENIINANKYDNVYEITEVLDEEQFSKYTRDDGSLFNRLIDYKHQLANSSKFEFYAFANNFI